MPTTYSYLPLIGLWEEYISTMKNGDVEHFAVWILSKRQQSRTMQPDHAPLTEYFDQQTDSHNYSQGSSEAAFLLWRLSKFVRFYTRPVLLEFGLASQDDFAILAEVDYKKSCSKKEAIEANIIDPTTGVEIIRRLVKQGLLKEKFNEADRRERIISLTASGKKKLYGIYGAFANIQDVLADLNTAEREQLLAVLKSLDDFHTKQHRHVIKGGR